MDFETRNYYRKQIEQLSRVTSFNEASIARETVNCALDAVLSQDKSSREAHVGFYLVKQRKSMLEKKLGLKREGFDRFKIWLNYHSFFCFISCWLIISAILFSGLIIYLKHNDVVWYGAVAILSYTSVYIPITSIASSLITWFFMKIISPSIIPKIEIKGDIPQKLRTMVIIPALLTDSKRTIELINQLEVHYLANNHKLLDSLLPENSILSHDLLEGCIVRAGLITDVELIDSYPSGYIAYTLRLHRWTRGDWQLIP